jgi:hypothetical protein
METELSAVGGETERRRQKGAKERRRLDARSRAHSISSSALLAWTMVAGRATLVSSSSFSWRRATLSRLVQAAPPPAARRQRRLPGGGREWTTSGRYESVPSSGE